MKSLVKNYDVPAHGFRLVSPEIINPNEAALIFKRVTGKRKSVPRLVEQIHRYPYLGIFEYGDHTGRPKLTGIRRGRWEYFVKTRYCLWGPHGIFHDYEVEI